MVKIYENWVSGNFVNLEQLQIKYDVAGNFV